MSDVPVSVIIPCFNVQDTVERAVLSVVNQTQLPLEIILIDDMSTDCTWKKLHDIKVSYENKVTIRIFQNEFNKGAGETRNYGWDMAKGEYIAFLDADDAWYQQKLQMQYNFMQKNSQLIMSCHKLGINKSNKIVDSLKYFYISKTLALYKTYVSAPTVMIKRNIGYRFKENKRYSEDVWLWLNMLRDDVNIAYIENELGTVFKPFYGASGLSGNLWKMEKEELSNFIDLFKADKINILLLLTAFSFSILKFIKRVIKVNAKASCLLKM